MKTSFPSKKKTNVDEFSVDLYFDDENIFLDVHIEINYFWNGEDQFTFNKDDFEIDTIRFAEQNGIVTDRIYEFFGKCAASDLTLFAQQVNFMNMWIILKFYEMKKTEKL